MIKHGHFAWILSVSILTTTGAQAASLEKYGNGGNAAPTQQTVKSPREIAIETAVQDIRSADADKRKRLVSEYSSKAKAALKKGNEDEARFYNEILTRSGN